MGMQIIEFTLFALLAYNTLGWNRIICIIASACSVYKGYDIYTKHSESLQWSDFIILAIAGAGIFYIYITHRKQANAAK